MPGIPLFVVTHQVPGEVPAGDPPYTFVTEGVERAIELASSAADGKDVFLQGASMVQQCFGPASWMSWSSAWSPRC